MQKHFTTTEGTKQFSCVIRKVPRRSLMNDWTRTLHQSLLFLDLLLIDIFIISSLNSFGKWWTIMVRVLNYLTMIFINNDNYNKEYKIFFSWWCYWGTFNVEWWTLNFSKLYFYIFRQTFKYPSHGPYLKHMSVIDNLRSWCSCLCRNK